MPLPFTDESFKAEWRKLVIEHYASQEHVGKGLELEIALKDLQTFHMRGPVPYTVWKALPEKTQTAIQWRVASRWKTKALIFTLGACINYVVYHYLGQVIALYSASLIAVSCVLVSMAWGREGDLLDRMSTPRYSFQGDHLKRLNSLAKEASQKGALTDVAAQETQSGDITVVEVGGLEVCKEEI